MSDNERNIPQEVLEHLQDVFRRSHEALVTRHYLKSIEAFDASTGRWHCFFSIPHTNCLIYRQVRSQYLLPRYREEMIIHHKKRAGVIIPCCVCMETEEEFDESSGEDYVILPCFHCIHEKALRNIYFYQEKNPRCPLCRMKI